MGEGENKKRLYAYKIRDDVSVPSDSESQLCINVKFQLLWDVTSEEFGRL